MWQKWPESNCDDARRTRIAELELVTDTPVSPKRLMLRPHVGSPETTYRKPSDAGSGLCEEMERHRTEKTQRYYSISNFLYDKKCTSRLKKPYRFYSSVNNLDIGVKEVCDQGNAEKKRKSECFHIKLEDSDCCDEAGTKDVPYTNQTENNKKTNEENLNAHNNDDARKAT